VSGPSPEARKRALAARRQPGAPGNECDLSFTVDLAGVRPDALRTLAVGSTLKVETRTHGPHATLTCVSDAGEVVGSLAAFPGIAKLLACIQVGHRYRASVVDVAPTRCVVTVVQIKP